MDDSNLNHLARLFVAFPIPKDQTEIIKSIYPLNRLTEQIRWTRLENLHITLFFLGEVRVESILFISQAISNVISHTTPFIFDFEKISLEGKNKNSGMIWMRFFKNEFYSVLYDNLFNAVQSFLKITHILKDPIPHITIARFRKGLEADLLNLSLKKKFEIPEISYCELWQTIHTKEGVIYKSLKKFSFMNS